VAIPFAPRSWSVTTSRIVMRQGWNMVSGFRYRSTWYVSLLVILWAPLAYGQEVNECKRDCRSEYWKGVSTCYRSSTAYGEIIQCRDALQSGKRKCTRRCSRPSRPEPTSCRRLCDRDYWESHGDCYQSSSRYNEIRECDASARETKNNCTKGCRRRGKGASATGTSILRAR
jgi:hypothetical protein